MPDGFLECQVARVFVFTSTQRWAYTIASGFSDRFRLDHSLLLSFISFVFFTDLNSIFSIFMVSFGFENKFA